MRRMGLGLKMALRLGSFLLVLVVVGLWASGVMSWGVALLLGVVSGRLYGYVLWRLHKAAEPPWILRRLVRRT